MSNTTNTRIVISAHDRATTTINNVGTSIAGMTKAALAMGTGIGAALGAAKLASTAIRTVTSQAREVITLAASFEQLALGLETVTGSAAGAERSLAWIKEFTARTPYQLQQTANAFKLLTAYGIDAAKALPVIGDAASSMGKDLDQATNAYASAVMGKFESLRQFGVNTQTIGNQVVFTWQQNGEQMVLETHRTQRGISDALNQVFSRFEGGMARQMRSWNGLMSNLRDTWDLFRLQIMDNGPFAVMRDQLQSLVDYWQTVQGQLNLEAWAANASMAVLRVFEESARAALVLVGGLEGAITWYENKTVFKDREAAKEKERADIHEQLRALRREAVTVGVQRTPLKNARTIDDLLPERFINPSSDYIPQGPMADAIRYHGASNNSLIEKTLQTVPYTMLGLYGVDAGAVVGGLGAQTAYMTALGLSHIPRASAAASSVLSAGTAMSKWSMAVPVPPNPYPWIRTAFEPYPISPWASHEARAQTLRPDRGRPLVPIRDGKPDWTGIPARKSWEDMSEAERAGAQDIATMDHHLLARYGRWYKSSAAAPGLDEFGRPNGMLGQAYVTHAPLQAFERPRYWDLLFSQRSFFADLDEENQPGQPYYYHPEPVNPERHTEIQQEIAKLEASLKALDKAPDTPWATGLEKIINKLQETQYTLAGATYKSAPRPETTIDKLPQAATLPELPYQTIAFKLDEAAKGEILEIQTLMAGLAGDSFEVQRLQLQRETELLAERIMVNYDARRVILEDLTDAHELELRAQADHQRKIREAEQKAQEDVIKGHFDTHREWAKSMLKTRLEAAKDAEQGVRDNLLLQYEKQLADLKKAEDAKLAPVLAANAKRLDAIAAQEQTALDDLEYQKGLWWTALGEQESEALEKLKTYQQARLEIIATARENELAEEQAAEWLALEEQRLLAWESAWEFSTRNLREYMRQYYEDVKAMSNAAAQGMQQGFQTFFVDAMKGELKSFADYFRLFTNTIIQEIARIQAAKIAAQIMTNVATAWVGAPTAAQASAAGFGQVVPKTAVPAPMPFADGGISTGPRGGYLATLHGTEAVIPLPKGRSIPVEMRGGSNQAPPVIVQVINQTKEPVEAHQQQPRFDGKQWVVGIVLEAIGRNEHGMADMVRGAARA